MIPTPKYSIGDVVWDVDVEIINERLPCPDCGDTRTWTATSRAGELFTINCLRCSQTYAGLPRDVPPLMYQKSTYTVRPLTIGSVRIDTSPHMSEVVQYMCRETGVGSGRLYDESRLYASEAEARAVASVLSSEQQARLDGGPVNAIRREYAASTLSASFPHVWQDEIYHAWVSYRELRECCDELLADADDEYELNAACRERLREALEERPWRRPHPIGALIDAVRDDLGVRSDASGQHVRQALAACVPPEHRTRATTSVTGE